jgi:hypothetical protein
MSHGHPADDFQCLCRCHTFQFHPQKLEVRLSRLRSGSVGATGTPPSSDHSPKRRPDANQNDNKPRALTVPSSTKAAKSRVINVGNVSHGTVARFKAPVIYSFAPITPLDPRGLTVCPRSIVVSISSRVLARPGARFWPFPTPEEVRVSTGHLVRSTQRQAGQSSAHAVPSGFNRCVYGARGLRL